MTKHAAAYNNNHTQRVWRCQLTAQGHVQTSATYSTIHKAETKGTIKLLFYLLLLFTHFSATVTYLMLPH